MKLDMKYRLRERKGYLVGSLLAALLAGFWFYRSMTHEGATPVVVGEEWEEVLSPEDVTPVSFRFLSILCRRDPYLGNECVQILC